VDFLKLPQLDIGSTAPDTPVEKGERKSDEQKEKSVIF